MGEAQVGKSWLIKVLHGINVDVYEPTLGVDMTPIVHHDQRLNVWDTAGDPRYEGLGSVYYIGADIGVLMYDAQQNRHGLSKYEKEFSSVCPGTLLVKCVNLRNEKEPTQYNRPEQHLFFINLQRNEGVSQLMDHIVKHCY